MGLKVNCPSCGGPVEFKSSISLLTVCPYCRSALLRKDLDVENLGKVAILHDDESVLQLGSTGQFERMAFSIVGRIQMKYDEGFWNEWFITLQDGRSGWLGEAMGEYIVSFAAKPREAVPAESTLKPGASLPLNGTLFEVRDIEEATYASAEGELPGEFPIGESARFIDLASVDNRSATLDFSETPPLVYIGKYVDFDALKFQNLRRSEA